MAMKGGPTMNAASFKKLFLNFPKKFLKKMRGTLSLRRAKNGMRRNEKGLALIFVLSLITVILMIVGELLFEGQITVRNSIGERDRQRAEMAALTGTQFAKLLITLETQISDLTDDNNKSLPPQVKAAAKGMADGMKAQLGGKSLFQMLDGFPIGAEGLDSIKDLSKVNINAMLDDGLLAALKSVPGFFVIKSTNESGKLNLNLLEGSERVRMMQALTRLFSTPRESKFLEEKGYPPARLVANLKDYIDRDNTDEADKSDEESQYQKLNFVHKAKNGRLESLEELRRIPGFHDDEIYNLFTPYLTVWPLDAKEKSLDINEASVELLSALLTKEGNEPNEQEFDKLEDFRSENKTFGKVQELSDFFTDQDKDTKEIISRLVGLRSSVYRIEVRGVSQNTERSLVMVFEHTQAKSSGAGKPPPVNPAGGQANPDAGAGAAGSAGTSGAGGSGASAPAGGLRIVYQRFR